MSEHQQISFEDYQTFTKRRQKHADSAGESNAAVKKDYEEFQEMGGHKGAYKLVLKVKKMSDGKQEDYLRALKAYFVYENLVVGEDLVDKAEAASNGEDTPAADTPDELPGGEDEPEGDTPVLDPDTGVMNEGETTH